jgi:hypothetical protein
MRRPPEKEEAMYASKQISRIVVLATAIAALLLLAGPASALSKPAAMTKAEYRALMLRSQALNEKYGLGQGMTHAESRALMLRSDALNKTYHLGAYALSQPAVVKSGNGFAWSAFGIGAAAAVGLGLVAGGTVVGSRRGRTVLRARSS